jgi:hypothetical protein
LIPHFARPGSAREHPLEDEIDKVSVHYINNGRVNVNACLSRYFIPVVLSLFHTIHYYQICQIIYSPWALGGKIVILVFFSDLIDAVFYYFLETSFGFRLLRRNNNNSAFNLMHLS